MSGGSGWAHPTECTCAQCIVAKLTRGPHDFGPGDNVANFAGVAIRALPGIPPGTAYLAAGREPEQIVKLVNLRAPCAGCETLCEDCA